MDILKEWIDRRGNAFSSAAKEYGLPAPKGVLIIGIPGTGKSLISKAVGSAWAMPVLRLDIGSLFGSFIGQSEANMRKALKTAEALAPCILWIDELEKSLGNNSGGTDGGTTSRVFGSFFILNTILIDIVFGLPSDTFVCMFFISTKGNQKLKVSTI